MNILKSHWFERDEPTQSYGLVLGQAVLAGVAPFQPKQIDISMDYDIDLDQERILVEVVFFNGYTIRHTERLDRWDIVDRYHEGMDHVGEAMIWAFRNRETSHIPDTIVLGEN